MFLLAFLQWICVRSYPGLLMLLDWLYVPWRWNSTPHLSVPCCEHSTQVDQLACLRGKDFSVFDCFLLFSLFSSNISQVLVFKRVFWNAIVLFSYQSTNNWFRNNEMCLFFANEGVSDLDWFLLFILISSIGVPYCILSLIEQLCQVTIRHECGKMKTKIQTRVLIRILEYGTQDWQTKNCWEFPVEGDYNHKHLSIYWKMAQYCCVCHGNCIEVRIWNYLLEIDLLGNSLH